jgi:hypothetical protein
MGLLAGLSLNLKKRLSGRFFFGIDYYDLEGYVSMDDPWFFFETADFTCSFAIFLEIKWGEGPSFATLEAWEILM